MSFKGPKQEIMRRSTLYIIITLALLAVSVFLAGYSAVKIKQSHGAAFRTGRLVSELDLTDLALFTEASYTRHLSQTDFTTPLQDSPLSFEHFPSGSLVGPPAHLEGGHVKKH
jgi:hypothetical protein